MRDAHKRPELVLVSQQLFWRDYGHITAGRRGGFGAMPIPPSEVFAFQDAIYPERADDVEWKLYHLAVISRMDLAQRQAVEKDDK